MAISPNSPQRMKIGIDARLWSQTGIGRYVRNLILNLAEIDNKNEYVIFVVKKDREEIGIKLKKYSNWKIVVFNTKWHSILEQINFPKVINKEKIDLMHFPYFSVPIFYRGSYVVTIHDLIYHHFISGEASTLPLWLYGFKMLAYRLIINTAAKRSKKIIAVSHFTKEDIIENLMVNKRKIEVVYEGANDFKSLSGEKVDYKDYFLFVGNVYPHKNAEKLVKAFEEFSKNNDYKLVFVGKDDYFYQKLRKTTKKLEKAGKVIYEFDITDKKLTALYKNSLALIRPSLMEGFSLPPIEALMAGTIPLVSDIPVHREILGDRAIYFNQKDIYDIVSKMNFVAKLTNQKREELISKGKERISSFSWKKAAQETLHIYEGSPGL